MTVTELKKAFVEIYGGSEDDLRVFSAAGRVNLIGEHIDYCGGKVFPAALNLRTTVVARKTNADVIRLAATTISDRVTLEINNLDAYRDLKWGDYQAGVAFVMQQAGYEIVGCDLLYDTTVPFGSGLSSSASIEVATGRTLAAFSAEKGGKGVDLIDLAVLGQKSENTYNGVNCGIMDQFAIAMGKKDCAIFLDTATLQYEYVPLKLENAQIVIACTNKKRGLGDSKYNERRSECEEALAELQKELDVETLGDLTEEQFEAHKALIQSEVRQRRAKHAVCENVRTIKAVDALQGGNIKLFGELMNASHESLAKDYEVTGLELDTIVEAAWQQKGVIGARMTGAGFGGCSVSIVEEDAIDEFIKNVGEVYKEKVGYAADFYVVGVGDGPMKL